jgi:hypothetical protein
MKPRLSQVFAPPMSDRWIDCITLSRSAAAIAGLDLRHPGE